VLGLGFPVTVFERVRSRRGLPMLRKPVPLTVGVAPISGQSWAAPGGPHRRVLRGKGVFG